MILKTGNMWSVYGSVDLFCITTNSTVNQKGALVMGRGVALQAKIKFPGIEKLAAPKIKSPYYGLVIIPEYNVGLFQVKRDFKQNASLDIIGLSVSRLILWMIQFYTKNKYWPLVALNFPGIGYGKLKKEDVLPIINLLPNNVEVWEYEKIL